MLTVLSTSLHPYSGRQMRKCRVQKYKQFCYAVYPSITYMKATKSSYFIHFHFPQHSISSSDYNGTYAKSFPLDAYDENGWMCLVKRLQLHWSSYSGRGGGGLVVVEEENKTTQPPHQRQPTTILLHTLKTSRPWTLLLLSVARMN